MENQVHISDDVIFEILLKLPAKSLAKFNCVSKHWLSTIRSKLFIQIYMSRSSTRPCFLFKYVTRSALSVPQLHFISLSQDDPSSSDYHSTMVIIPDAQYVCVSPSIRGLICLSSHSKILICNPTTSQLFPLPDVTTSRTRIRIYTFFGYDPINDEYKVLRLTLSSQGSGPIIPEEHQVFTVGADRPWRNIECKFQHRPVTHGLCKNGVIYYGAWAKLKSEKYVIMGFDVRLEEFSVFELPNGIEIGGDYQIELFNYKGKLGLMNHHISGNSSDLWVAEDVKKEDWCKIDVFPGLPIYYWCRGTISNDELVFSPTGLTVDYFFVWCYHMNTKRLRTIRFQQFPHPGNDITPDLDHVPNPLILESTFNPVNT